MAKSRLAKDEGSDAFLVDEPDGNDKEPPSAQHSMNSSFQQAVNDKKLMNSRPGCSVGVYLVRSDGQSCYREQVTDGVFRHSHPSTQQLLIMWQEAPRTILVLKKLGIALLAQCVEVVEMLVKEGMEGSKVLVEPQVYEEISEAVATGQVDGEMLKSIHILSPSSQVDLIMCLGGDGVILHASSLFQGPCPPLLGFNLGSMGFLAPHTFTGMKKSVEEAMMLSAPNEDEKYQRNLAPCDGVPITLRMRLYCEIWTNGTRKEDTEGFHILNELVIDRGPSSFLSMIECYELTLNNELRLLTKVQADGLIVSTATGSTAYSVSAGGSMVHPSVPAILVTPICPHSLSFRPVVLPDSAVILLRVPEDARSTAWVCFDGKSRQEVKRGDGVMIQMSQYPMPTINWGDQMSEFVGSLVRCLNWNDREEQKPLTDVGPLNAMFQKVTF
mmetsp:Transcript_8266/g.17049  ORF Transcript_8266/g.17049 Transcript_8266/m.17049 type:complete len:442 (+) Transcript_8266:137-1462(+)